MILLLMGSLGTQGWSAPLGGLGDARWIRQCECWGPQSYSLQAGKLSPMEAQQCIQSWRSSTKAPEQSWDWSRAWPWPAPLLLLAMWAGASYSASVSTSTKQNLWEKRSSGKPWRLSGQIQRKPRKPYHFNEVFAASKYIPQVHWTTTFSIHLYPEWSWEWSFLFPKHRAVPSKHRGPCALEHCPGYIKAETSTVRAETCSQALKLGEKCEGKWSEAEGTVKEAG